MSADAELLTADQVRREKKDTPFFLNFDNAAFFPSKAGWRNGAAALSTMMPFCLGLCARGRRAAGSTLFQNCEVHGLFRIENGTLPRRRNLARLHQRGARSAWRSP